MSATGKRKPVYQLRLLISVSIEELEDWLHDNCDGKFSYSLEGIKETEAVFKKLELLFSFEHDKDRQNFKEAVKSGVF